MPKKRATRRKKKPRSKGSMSSLRGGFKALPGKVGGGGKGAGGARWLDWVLWIGVAALAAYLLSQSLG